MGELRCRSACEIDDRRDEEDEIHQGDRDQECRTQPISAEQVAGSKAPSEQYPETDLAGDDESNDHGNVLAQSC